MPTCAGCTKSRSCGHLPRRCRRASRAARTAGGRKSPLCRSSPPTFRLRSPPCPARRGRWGRPRVHRHPARRCPPICRRPCPTWTTRTTRPRYGPAPTPTPASGPPDRQRWDCRRWPPQHGRQRRGPRIRHRAPRRRAHKRRNPPLWLPRVIACLRAKTTRFCSQPARADPSVDRLVRWRCRRRTRRRRCSRRRRWTGGWRKRGPRDR